MNIEELNGKITTRSVLVAINGTTDETGGIIVNVNTDFTNKFVISNISDTSITPYKITIINHSSDFIYFRFRKYSDNSAVTNTAVDTTVLVVGMN